MKTRIARSVAVTTVASLVLGGSLLVAHPSYARSLPTAYEAELRDARQARFGQTINLTACNKFDGFRCTRYARLTVRVDSLTFRNTNGWPPGTPTYDIDVQVRNFSQQRAGVLPQLRCSNASERGAFFVDSVETQSLPARSRTSGSVVSSFPLGPQGAHAPAIPARDCRNAVIWLEAPVRESARVGRVRTFGSAYVRLPQQLLNSLNQQADTAAATAGD